MSSLDQPIRPLTAKVYRSRAVQKYESLLRGLGIYQVGSAVILIIWTLSTSSIATFPGNAQHALLLVPISVTVFAGINLYRLKSSGYNLTYLSLILQTVWISGPRTTFDYFTGLRLWVGWAKNGTEASILNLDVIGKVSAGFSFDPREVSFGIGVNLVAILFMVMLGRWRQNLAISLNIQKDMIAHSEEAKVQKLPNGPAV